MKILRRGSGGVDRRAGAETEGAFGSPRNAPSVSFADSSPQAVEHLP